MVQMFQDSRVLSSQSAVARTCLHCQSVLSDSLADEYCCHGCRSAHALIAQFELNRFYHIVQENHDALRPADVQRGDYKLFDNPQYQADFVEADPEGRKTAHFYLDNLSCYACVWVCEEMVRRIDASASLLVNMSDGEATLSFDPKRQELSSFLQNLEALGFAVSPHRHYQADRKSDIARIGVSLFCLMNIMMLAFPEYLSAESLEVPLRNLFRWISMFLAGLAISYGAWPLLKGAVRALWQRQLHLDLPIGLALVVCYTYSVWNTLRGEAFVYYDTTTAVVALLLIGRYVQARALERILRKQNQYLEADSAFVRIQRSGSGSGLELVPLADVLEGQIFRVLPGELIPLAARLLSAQADVSYGLLKGESQARVVRQGEGVEAGAVNGAEPIELEALEPGVQSYLLRLQKQAQTLMSQKADFYGLSERMAKAFVALVLIMAAVALFGFWGRGPEVALSRFAAVLLVACPCIFGFGSPLVIGRAFHLAMQRGLLFRHQKALERLTQVQDFYFDKTGTLTSDESLVCAWSLEAEALAASHIKPDELFAVLKTLPQLTRHHVPKALAAALPSSDTAGACLPVKAVREWLGQGVSLVWQERELRMGRYAFCTGSQAPAASFFDESFVSLDGVIVLRFRLEEELREDAMETLQTLKSLGKSLWILSGDSECRARSIGERLGLAQEHIAAQLTPDQKTEQIRSSDRSAMIGNGINDSLALSQVAIGIALRNATDSLKEKADLIFQEEGVQPLLTALAVARSTRRALQRCFGFALVFNALGLILAFGGWASPVAAAILMPISSLSIFTLAQSWGVKPLVPASESH